MVQLKQRFQSFEDYLAYDDGTENLYELFNGELIEVPPESGFNVETANFLFAVLLPLVGHRRLRGHGLELEVRGEPRNRYPDLSVIYENQIEPLRRRNTLRILMGPPMLVVEIVSPGEVQRNRDYIAKRSQYQDLGIPEYWIVDPQTATVLVLELRDGVYCEAVTFSGGDELRSLQLGPLNITAQALLNAASSQTEDT
ncbi:Uma2 family endonuclease [Nodosilinea sp. LEGE 06152]|uniref:Uma2 family endonuclease n=1 Tax=Nodosilinea sp. LEGE 06152 TaxID=2777966 RepID=UPI0018803E7A|nr:Uma2 family endonuclease [Nodosilinea sp. LEGE 06152]MBE9160326.1 Uma2 family endonuclease [Nodosilinea sp. LEGE 06152]